MLKKFKKRFRNERGDALVSTIIIFPLMIIMLVTAIDFSIYMANRGQVQGVARDGARTVAIMGGNGNATQATPIEEKYGSSRKNACEEIKSEAFKSSTTTAIECNIIKGLESHKGLVNVEIVGVKCNPPKAESIGDRVTCEVSWKYGGIPGSGLTLMRNGASFNEEPALKGINTTTGSSESEVNLSDISLVDRKNNLENNENSFGK